MLHWLCVNLILRQGRNWFPVAEQQNRNMKNKEELRLFIKKKLQSGYPEGEMKNELLQEGYALEQIEKAIYDKPVDEKTPGTKTKSSDKVSMWTLAGVSLVILGISLNAAPTNFQQYANFILVAGILCLVMKYIIVAAKDGSEKE